VPIGLACKTWYVSPSKVNQGEKMGIENNAVMSTNKEKPVQEVRIGAIKAAIWKNDTSNGVRYNVTFSRLYRDKEQDQWKSTDSFGRDDLLVLGKVADTAHTWIFDQGRENNAESQD
jgi:hypothetical protein